MKSEQSYFRWRQDKTWDSCGVYESLEEYIREWATDHYGWPIKEEHDEKGNKTLSVYGEVGDFAPFLMHLIENVGIPLKQFSVYAPADTDEFTKLEDSGLVGYLAIVRG